MRIFLKKLLYLFNQETVSFVISRSCMISPAGDIKNVMDVPWLFQGLRAEKKTGTVVFAREKAIKKVYFQNGDIIFAASNLSEDWLGEWLVRAGKLTREQCATSS